MNLDEATKILKNNGYTIIKENEEQDLLFDKFTAIKNELTAEESKLVGLDAIFSNIRNGHTKYEDGGTGIVVHDKEYENNPGIFKKYIKLAKEQGFDVTIKYCNWGVYIKLDWVF